MVKRAELQRWAEWLSPAPVHCGKAEGRRRGFNATFSPALRRSSGESPLKLVFSRPPKLYKYGESYKEALLGFARAAALDPALLEPPLREQQLLKFLGRLSALVQQKGMLKAKRLNSLMSSIQNKEQRLYKEWRYPTASGQHTALTMKPLRSLNPGTNTGTVVLGKVVFSLTDEEKVPFTFGLIDADGSCLAVMVYNIAESWGVLIGDTVAVPEPHLKQHSIEHSGKSFTFSSVRVESPLVLIVNGKAQSMTSQAAAVVAYKPQTE
ncbi:tetratricopeptide repeat protein 5 [Scyliorhinus canicula]|uniref:tetratricopeptide repeat protein 5 n=1 Tax=Scyliorhinus canicula TaxID=7830 RepID=UPI0018F742B1|nr:tetratricopeptide repeat protein 5 [Scyliorhinus canicula]